MPNPNAKTDKLIFVSYSHFDREKVLDLRNKLSALDFKLWRDIEDMPTGERWWSAIQNAIQACDTLVLCMSPDAIASKNVVNEWRYAREIGKRVLPVVIEPVDFTKVPRWMGRIDWADFREGAKDANLVWERFINQLNIQYVPHKVPFMVEPLPPDFVERPNETEPLIQALVDNTHGAVAISAALRGAGGYGKTTLARAICHDNRVRGAFDDGFLWVTLGQNLTDADLMGRISELVDKLTERHPEIRTLDGAADELRKAIGDEYILLVIDDVWETAHLKLFLSPGLNAATLITTRNAGTLPLKAFKQDVDAMRTEESLALLRYEIPAGEDVRMQALTARLGEWPLILKLANAAIRKRIERGEALGAALDWVGKALDQKGFVALDNLDDPNDRHRAASATLAVSLDLLDADQKTQYELLAIFPEDVDVPLTALGKLWDCDDFDTEELCDRFAGLSLLLTYNLSARTIRLHDVVRTYLRDTFKLYLSRWNKNFLDAYPPSPPPSRSEDKGRDWTTLSHNEPYLWRWLAYHLIEAEQSGELYKLVTQSQDWMNFLHSVSSGNNAFSRDLQLAINNLKEVSTPEQILVLAQLCIAKEVIDTRVRGYQDNDLATLVYLDKEIEAINNARLRERENLRFIGLLTIFNTLKSLSRISLALIDEIYALGIAHQNDEEWVSLLGELALTLWQTNDVRCNQVFIQIRGVAERIEEDWKRVTNLADIAGFLIHTGNPSGITILDEIFANVLENEDFDEDTLRDLSVEFAQAQRYEEAIEIIGDISDVRTRSWAYRDVVEELVKVQRCDEALDLAKNVVGVSDRCSALSKIAIAMASNQDERANSIINDVRAIISGIEDYSREDAIHYMAVALAEMGRFDEALDLANNVLNTDMGLFTLHEIAFSMAKAKENKTEQILNEALRMHIHSTDNGAQPTALGQISKALASLGQFDKALQFARYISPLAGANRALALADIVRIMAENDDIRTGIVLEEALTAARGLDHQYGLWIASSCAKLATTMIRMQDARAGSLFDEALMVAHNLLGKEWQAIALSTVAVQLAKVGDNRTNSILTEALGIVNQLKEPKIPNPIGDVIFALAEIGKFEEALNMAHSIDDIDEQLKILSKIVVSMSKAHHEQVHILLDSILAKHISAGVPIDHFSQDDLALAMAEVGNFSEAFKMIQGELDEFIKNLAQWHDILENKQDGLTVAVLREITRIAGWIRPDWQQISKELA